MLFIFAVIDEYLKWSLNKSFNRMSDSVEKIIDAIKESNELFEALKADSHRRKRYLESMDKKDLTGDNMKFTRDFVNSVRAFDEHNVISSKLNALGL